MTTWPEATKTHALDQLANGTTLADTHRNTGVPKPTLIRWAKAAGMVELSSERSREKTAQATAALMAVTAERRANLAAGLLADAERLRAQLFAPCVEKRAMVVSGGKDSPASIEQVTIELDEPTFRDKQTILTAVAIAVDKIQLLTGEATERSEHLGVVRDHVLDDARQKARHLQAVPA